MRTPPRKPVDGFIIHTYIYVYMERCREFEEDRFRVRLHGRAYMSHAGLLGRLVVDSITLGENVFENGRRQRRK